MLKSMMYMKVQNINNPYKCALCTKKAYKNANGLVRHIKNAHNLKIESYFKDHITIEQFKNIAIKKILLSQFPLKYRLNDICLECGKNHCNFQSFGKGFCIFCSEHCANKNKIHKQNKYENTKKAIMKKYGVENISQLKATNLKVKKTKLVKYGDENYNNIEKQRYTLKKKYGHNITSFTQTKEYKIKTKKTSLKKYGVKHFTQSDTVKNKITETNLEKYGVKYTLQVPEIRSRIAKTNLEKYGFASKLDDPKVRSLGAQVKKNNFTARLEKYDFFHVQIIDKNKNIFLCNVCNKHFIQQYITLKNGAVNYPRCIKCFPKKAVRDSFFQQEFMSLLNKHDIKFTTNDRSILGNRQELDFYLPEYNLAIELNGLYWHSEYFGNKNKKYHINKTNICEKKGIRLLHIFSDEWQNKRDIVISKILHILNKNNNKNIYARDCFIKEVDNKTKNIFLNKNHIQGTERSSFIKLGLFTKKTNKLIGLMTFSKLRLNLGNKNNTDGIYELLRFATDINYRCVGGASKLLKYFIKTNKPNKIISYADKRWSTSLTKSTNVYKALNFKLIKHTTPNYWYLNPRTEYKKRENRFKYRKQNLSDMFRKSGFAFDSNKSEWCNMKSIKFDRVWDCGTLKYELSL